MMIWIIRRNKIKKYKFDIVENTIHAEVVYTAPDEIIIKFFLNDNGRMLFARKLPTKTKKLIRTDTADKEKDRTLEYVCIDELTAAEKLYKHLSKFIAEEFCITLEGELYTNFEKINEKEYKKFVKKLKK